MAWSRAVDKVCPRYMGTGLRPIPGTQFRRVIEQLAGGLQREGKADSVTNFNIRAGIMVPIIGHRR